MDRIRRRADSKLNAQGEFVTSKHSTKSGNGSRGRKARGSGGKRGPAQGGPNGGPNGGKTQQQASARELALAIAESGLDHKAANVEVIDVQGKVDYADFVVVMSGRSDRQVAALAKDVEKDVESRGVGRCLATEGLPQGNWVLMDFGDVVVHIFHQDTRGYYDLESLWIDAARVEVAE
jgi:ribosome-associated protein